MLKAEEKLLENYLFHLNRLDPASKKFLINKLGESLESKKEKTDLNSLFGAWEDEKSSDQIISEIRNSRV